MAVRVTHTRTADRTLLTHPLASLTVINTPAIRDDAFDPALMLLGMDAEMALAARLNLAALFIARTHEGFAERATPRVEELAASDTSSKVRRAERARRSGAGRGAPASDGDGGRRGEAPRTRRME